MAMASGVMTNVMPVGRFIHGGLNHDEPWDFSWDLMGLKWDLNGIFHGIYPLVI